MSVFYFHVSNDVEEMLGCYGIVIVEKEFWDMNQHINDDHISEEIELALGAKALEDMFEIAESMFEHDMRMLKNVPEGDPQRNELIRILEERGFVQNKDFSKFIDR